MRNVVALLFKARWVGRRYSIERQSSAACTIIQSLVLEIIPFQFLIIQACVKTNCLDIHVDGISMFSFGQRHKNSTQCLAFRNVDFIVHALTHLVVNISCCLLEENEFSLICSLNICFKLFRNLLQNLSHILERNVYFVVCMSCPICRKKRIIKTSRIKKNRKCFNLNNLCTFLQWKELLS